MKKIMLLLMFVISGCSSTAGPFITNISSDGDDGLVIEKCMAKFDPWMSTVSTTECSSVPIKLRTRRPATSK